jgi:UDP-N-acetylmuramyl pentapeptide phosphotransferase/UDP-N-acetylglucosamine-1-phosphate transferase
MIGFFQAAAVAAAVAFLMTVGLSSMGRFSKLGHDLHSGVQKFHANPTSRLGGVAIFAGLVAAVAFLYHQVSDAAQLLGLLLLVSIPVFLGGLVEDLTHKVSPNMRLMLTMASAALAFAVLDVGVRRTDIFLVDWLLTVPFASFLITLLVVGGFTQSVNIVDGFHGLASGVVVLMLVGLYLMAWQLDDGVMMQLTVITMGATLGFFVVNWPSGRIFLGDAGAYLLGFWVVELGLILISRHPQLSPMAPVVLGIFPLVETLFSMYRRKFVRQHPINHPDSLHLHTLVYRRLVLHPLKDVTSSQRNAANASVAVYFWLPSMALAALSNLFLFNTYAQIAMMVLFFIAYVWMYQSLVHFKSPRFLIRR